MQTSVFTVPSARMMVAVALLEHCTQYVEVLMFTLLNVTVTPLLIHSP